MPAACTPAAYLPLAVLLLLYGYAWRLHARCLHAYLKYLI